MDLTKENIEKAKQKNSRDPYIFPYLDFVSFRLQATMQRIKNKVSHFFTLGLLLDLDNYMLLQPFMLLN